MFKTLKDDCIEKIINKLYIVDIINISIADKSVYNFIKKHYYDNENDTRILIDLSNMDINSYQLHKYEIKLLNKKSNKYIKCISKLCKFRYYHGGVLINFDKIFCNNLICKNIDNLCIGSTNIRQINLSHFEDLQSLDISYTYISSIESLKNCTKLTFLDLNNTNITDISALKYCTKLTYLNMNDIRLYEIKQHLDISPLIHCELKYLMLRRNLILDFTPLLSLIKLLELVLDKTNICDLHFISNCISLNILKLTDTILINVDKLSNCINLKKIYAFKTNLSGIEKIPNYNSIKIYK
jgi:hypothetical protein